MYKECRKKFFKYFVNDKKMLAKYALLSFIAGILALFGVALTYPFINRLIQEPGKASLFLGIVIIAAFLCKNAVMILYNYLQVKFTKNCETEIIKKFVKFFLYGDYNTVSKIPFSQKQQVVSYLIPNTINNFLIRILNLWVNFFIFGLITTFLFIKFFTATIITLCCSIMLLTCQYMYFKSKTKNLSLIINKAGEQTNLSYNEALLNIKNVKIAGGEEFFYKRYSGNLKDFQGKTSRLLFYNTVPPYITEPFIIILLLILLSIISIQNITNIASLIASYALIVSAVFRLAPTISRIQVNLTSLQTTYPLAEQLIEFYEQYNVDKITPVTELRTDEIRDSIELKDISFSYGEKEVLDSISLKINKGEFVGIAGPSGAGKTTLADIISGLLRPSKGEILLDSKPVKALKLKIGYIPQEYTAIQASIRENVAFGSDNIDDNKVVDALKKAQLYDFIISSFKEGIYASPFVDNLGLSQGQKQRLAIARALYQEPDIIILDEATSSLDLKTEVEICNVLNNLKGNKTIIVIAHRLSTIKSADKIIFMKDKHISGISSFNKLYSDNEDFRELVDLSAANLLH